MSLENQIERLALVLEKILNEGLTLKQAEQVVEKIADEVIAEEKPKAKSKPVNVKQKPVKKVEEPEADEDESETDEADEADEDDLLADDDLDDEIQPPKYDLKDIRVLAKKKKTEGVSTQSLKEVITKYGYSGFPDVQEKDFDAIYNGISKLTS